MTIDTRPTTIYPCPSVAYLVVDGREVGLLKCSLEAGHDEPRYVSPQPLGAGLTQPLEAEPGTPHECTLRWENPESIIESWPEYDDPDEGFDLEVDIAPAEVVKSAERTADLNNGGLGLVTSIDDE